LPALRVGAERVDDPDLAKMDGCGDSCGLFVSRDELDVLDSTTLDGVSAYIFWDLGYARKTYIRDGKGADDCSRVQVPQPQSVGMHNPDTWLEDGDWNNKVGGYNEVVIPVNGETVRRELLANDVDES
jgi:hypothetical protein